MIIMLPKIPQVRDSLSGLSVAECKPITLDESCLVVCESRNRLSPDYDHMPDDRVIILKQDAGLPISVRGLVEKVADEMNWAGHSHVSPRTNERSALASRVLALAVFLRPSSDDPLEFLNRVLEGVASARVTQWF